MPSPAFVPWPQAWTAALYGPDGFYRQPAGPAGHFRTAVHAAAPVLAGLLAGLARRHGCRSVVDLGAGRGELAAALAVAAPDLALHAVDVVDRPAGLPDRVGWTRAAPADGDPLPPWPSGRSERVLVVCWELLDVVPCPVLEADDDGVLREVLVQPRTGVERLGRTAAQALTPVERDWCRRWWPTGSAPGTGVAAEVAAGVGTEAGPGCRVEVGLARDLLWTALAGRVGSGLLLAVDYAHTAAGRPPVGSLSGFRSGRQVPPVPDGRCDLTAEVALDSAEAAAREAGRAGPGRLVDQRTALLELAAASGDAHRVPAELLDPGGLGGFSWLLQPVG